MKRIVFFSGNGDDVGIPTWFYILYGLWLHFASMFSLLFHLCLSEALLVCYLFFLPPSVWRALLPKNVCL